jgi:3-oxoacyl-[acyl-carrier-protein] synthase-3
MTRFATIVSTGRYIPEIEVSNDELRDRFAHIPDFVDNMEASTGITTRWWAPEEWCTSDIALRAAQQALDKAPRTST